MAVKFIFLILPLLTASFDFNILAIKRNVEVARRVIDDIQSERYIGCKYQDICPLGRFCYDDRLFGSCLNEQDDRKFVYELSSQFVNLLQNSMEQLWKKGFHWSDFYSQCILQSFIRSSEFQVEYDSTHCEEDNQPVYQRKQRDINFQDDNYVSRRLFGERLNELLEDVRNPMIKKGNEEEYNPKPRNEEGINPLSNSKEALSVTKVEYADPKMIRKIMKVAKRWTDEWIWLKFDKKITKNDKHPIMNAISDSLNISDKALNSRINTDHSTIYFKLPHKYDIPSTKVLDFFNKNENAIKGLSIVKTGIGLPNQIREEAIPKNTGFFITLIICIVVLFGVVLVLICFCIQKFRYKRDKMGDIISPHFNDTSTSSYKDLFRVSNNKESAPLKTKQCVSRIANKQHSGDTPAASSPVSTRSSTSSWTDEMPIATNMDIYTGHMILSYMEKHLKNKELFQAEWNSIESCEIEDCRTEVAMRPENISKNRFQNKIPYDKSRVILKKENSGDYINASLIVDSDPRLPAYIATQSPIEKTIADFWQMIWEQGVVIIINLTEVDETDVVRYWPKEGSQIYNTYEINLVSEHIWNDEYLVRNFYLKNMENTETKTVTQFHFLAWPFDKLPTSSRSILEFRRKVNKSYRSKSTPILVHCKDGCGRSGTYILLDLILNRIGKGLKEMDIAATLEHLRDQRMHLVKTEEQFGFVLNTISEEVNNILKVLNQ